MEGKVTVTNDKREMKKKSWLRIQFVKEKVENVKSSIKNNVERPMK